MFERYENAVQTALWNRLLRRMNSVSGHGNRKVTVEILTFLKAFFNTLRNGYLVKMKHIL
jgi:hypothetical protein